MAPLARGTGPGLLSLGQLTPWIERMLVSVIKQLLRRPAPAEIAPAQAATENELGAALESARAGDRAGARSRLEALLDREPENADALCALGDVLVDEGDSARADELFRRVLRTRPTSGPAHAGLGLALLAQGDLEGAHQEFALACKFSPADPDSWTHLGLVQLKLGNLSKAHDSLKRALDIAPKHAHAWNNLGTLEQKRGRMQQALACFKSAVEAKPDYATAHSNYGMALRDAENRALALHHLMEAVRLRPRSIAARHNLGVLLQDEGRFDEAREHLLQVLESEPASADTHVALGSVAHRQGEEAVARQHYQRALASDPEHAEAHAGLGELDLWVGNFAAGWSNYEYRLRGRASPARPFPNPVWQGEDLTGRTLLVYAEQGLGDVVMFASCLPDVIERARSVLVFAEKRVVGLLQRSFPRARVRAFEHMSAPDVAPEIASADYHVPMGSLPGFFRNEWPAFPQRGRYLHPDPERAAQWCAQLEGLGGRLRVGLVWRGGLYKTGQMFRSLELNTLLPLLREPEVRYVCLQHGDVAAELEAFERSQEIPIAYWRDAANKVEDTLGIMAGLDLVISVCGSAVHLAGALDRPVWVLVPAASGWRYLRDGERLPWYGSARMFRQPAHGDWLPAIKKVGDEIASFAPDPAR